MSGVLYSSWYSCVWSTSSFFLLTYAQSQVSANEIGMICQASNSSCGLPSTVASKGEGHKSLVNAPFWSNRTSASNWPKVPCTHPLNKWHESWFGEKNQMKNCKHLTTHNSPLIANPRSHVTGLSGTTLIFPPPQQTTTLPKRPPPLAPG